MAYFDVGPVAFNNSREGYKHEDSYVDSGAGKERYVDYEEFPVDIENFD